MCPTAVAYRAHSLELIRVCVSHRCSNTNERARVFFHPLSFLLSLLSLSLSLAHALYSLALPLMLVVTDRHVAQGTHLRDQGVEKKATPPSFLVFSKAIQAGAWHVRPGTHRRCCWCCVFAFSFFFRGKSTNVQRAIKSACSVKGSFSRRLFHPMFI